jgi:thiamine pyrophosphokinase
LLGIIFTGGQGPAAREIKQLFEKEVLNQRFENTLFFAADSGLEVMEKAGIKPDWITGDMDSLANPEKLNSFPPEKIIRLQHEKDFTDTEFAFSLAVKNGCQQIWILGGGGGRIDHIFGIRSLFERDIFPVRWTTDNADIYCVDANTMNTESLTVDVKQGTIVSVFPLGDAPWDAKSSGLKWQLDGLEWNRGFFGLSNVAINGEFTIKALVGRFMVILPLDKVIEDMED